MGGPASFFSGMSVTRQLVVSTMPAMLMAFSRAALVTLRGSMIPFFSMLPNSSTAAS